MIPQPQKEPYREPKPYQTPQIVLELELETLAGSPLGLSHLDEILEEDLP